MAFTVKRGRAVIVDLEREVENALSDFYDAAKLAGKTLCQGDITWNISKAPHTPPTGLPKGKSAVYVFYYNGICLKVGKAGVNSKQRFAYQHYNPKNAGSTLAKLILSIPDSINAPILTEENVGGWIKKNTDRVNFLVSDNSDGFLLGFLEAFLQLRWKPAYEGRG